MPYQAAVRKNAGFTLTEIIIALAIFTVLASGLISASIFNRKLVENNIYNNAATLAILSYIEQIQSMTYTELSNSAQNSQPLEFISTQQLLNGNFENMEQLITPNTETNVKILIDTLNDTTGQGSTVEMDMWITVTLNQMPGLEAIEAIIDYRYMRVSPQKAVYPATDQNPLRMVTIRARR